jgi:5-hydroxyisourate hydrolase-like protein (transthyretin family)
VAAEPRKPALGEGIQGEITEPAAPSLVEARGLPGDRIATSPDESLLRVLVVEQGTGRPVAGARVLVQKEEVDLLEWDEAWERWNDIEPMLAHGLGQAFESDLRGIATVPRPSRRVWVTADLGELHGERRTGPTDELCRIEMRAYHSLAIEVLDPLGMPMEGVRVALVQSEHGEWWNAWSGITGSDGRAELHKLEEKLSDENAPLALGPCLAVARPQQVEFTAATAPAGPVRFVLEPSGIVEVVMSDAQGRALDVTGRLQLGVVRSDLPAAISESGPHTVPVRAGSAVLEHVGLGLELEVRADVLGKRFRERTFAGPVTPGERVRVYLPLERSGTILSGRALDERGEPLRGVEITGEVQISAGSSRDKSFTTRTDAQGRFKGDLLVSLPADDGVSLSLAASTAGSAHRRAIVTVALPEDSSQVELGDVVLRQLDVLVRGTVVDEQGVPVGNVWIEARDAATQQDLLETTGWSRRALSDSEGRFVVASSSRPAAIELSAFSWGRVRPEPMRVPLGSENVVITFLRGGRLEGRALVPAGFDGEMLDFEFEYGRDRIRPRSWGISGDGSFEVPAAEPGVLVARISYCDQVLWERDDIEIRAGETTRLGEIDLRDRLYVIAIDVVDEAGSPVQRGTLECSVNPDAEPFAVIEIPPSGHVRIPSPQGFVSLLVHANGFRSERFDGVRPGDRLVLREGIVVRLSLPGDLPVVDPLLALRVIWSGPDAWEVEGPPAGHDGIVLVRLSEPGSYEFSWVLTNTLTGVQFSDEEASPTSVEVPESGVTQPVPLALDRGSLIRALEMARGGE